MVGALTFPSRGRWIFAVGEKTDEVVAERKRADVGIRPYGFYPSLRRDGRGGNLPPVLADDS